MVKLIISFILLSLGFSVLAAIYDGGTSSVSTTVLTANISDTATTASVSTTSGFSEIGVVYIGDEKIQYNGTTDTTLTYLTRGIDGTVAASHLSGRKVYSPATSVINDAEGYSVIETGAAPGEINMLTFPREFVTTIMPAITTFDYSFLRDNEIGQYLRYVGLCISTGFWFIVCYYIMAALGGVLNGIFNKF